MSSTFGASVTNTNDNGVECGTCLECEDISLTTSVGGTASGDCFAAIDMGGVGPVKVGCTNCAVASVTATQGVNLRTGPCGAQDCSVGRIDTKFVAQTPGVSVQVLWWKTNPWSCKLSATGCSESNSCGSPSCANGADSETKFSCAVGL